MNNPSNTKQISYSVLANGVNLVVSILSTFILPRFMGAEIEQYGYYQLYLFYTVYIGFFHFGWCDGILLKEGGKQYSDLNKPLYSQQFRIIASLEIFIALATIAVLTPIVNDANKLFVLWMCALNIIILMPRSMLQYLLQSTGRIKEYSIMLIIGRLVFLFSTVFVVSRGTVNYRYIIIGDVIGKFVGFMITIYFCRDIITTKPVRFLEGLHEAGNDILIGFSLLFSNIASQLTSGIAKYGIEHTWDIATFGKVSLSISISSMLMSFATAVAMVLYPILRRMPRNQMSNIYMKLRSALMIPILGALVLYYPVQSVLSLWLPRYADSLRYMAILFPVSIYSSKMLLLINTFIKSLRYEKSLLLINITAVICSILTTALSVLILKSLTFAVISILLNEIVKCLIAEFYISKKISVTFWLDAAFELCLTVIFIISNWTIGGWNGFFIYICAFTVYVLIKRNDVVGIITHIKKRYAT